MKLVKRNFRIHNPNFPPFGNIDDNSVIMDVKEPSYIETYEKVVPLTRTFQSALF